MEFYHSDELAQKSCGISEHKLPYKGKEILVVVSPFWIMPWGYVSKEKYKRVDGQDITLLERICETERKDISNIIISYVEKKGIKGYIGTPTLSSVHFMD